MLNIPILRNAILKSGVINSKKIVNSTLPKNIKELQYVPETVADSFEMIGKGAEGVVYKIKNSNFAIKIKNDAVLEKEINSPLHFSMNSLDKINYVKAKVGSNIKIMEYIKGESINPGTDLNKFSTDNIKDCLKYIYTAANQGFKHDCGGKNIIFDKYSGKLIPIDFINKRAGYQEEIINNTFIQLYPAVKNDKDVIKLLSKISLGFVDLLKDNTISAKGIKHISVELKNVKDLIRTNKKLAEAETFVCSLESKLKRIMSNKAMQSISKSFHDDFIQSINSLEKELNLILQ